MLHISLPAEIVFYLDSFPISNSLLVTWLVMAFLIAFSVLATRNLQQVPSSLYSSRQVPSGLQNFAEMILEGLLNFFETVVGERAKIFFPLATTFFLFIILGNWSGLIPGFGSIGFWETIEGKRVLLPIFRRVTADLNTTLALALFSVGAIQYVGLQQLQLSYLKKFFNFRGPVDLFVGILELVSEVARIISFSFRLFGNMFAGEVLILVISFLIPVIAPVPFLFLEIFVGFVQAFIFAMLTLVFLNMAVSVSQH